MTVRTNEAKNVIPADRDKGRGVRLDLSAGYVLTKSGSDTHEALHMYAPNGALCLTIHLDAAGPRVEVAAQSVAVVAEKSLHLRCENLAVEVEKDISMNAGGTVSTEGFAQVIRARTGDVQLRANDDIRIDGERIYLNSPYAPRMPDGPRMSLVQDTTCGRDAPPPES